MPKTPPIRPTAIRPGTSRPERMLAAAALIDQALICLRSHPDEADARLRDALQLLQAHKTIAVPDEDPAPARGRTAKRKP